MLRWLLRIVFLLLVIAILALAGFRGWAAFRETLDPVQAAGPEARFADVEGLRIHYKEWGPADGPPLVLVHGTMAWSDTWRDIAAPLGEAGIHVLAPDIPPFGLSDRPSSHVYSRASQSALITRFADAMRLDRFALAGHSFGGGATIEAALAIPDRIDRLILLDVALGLGREPSGPPLAALLDTPWLRNVAIAATFTNPLMLGKGLRDFVHDDTIVTDERIAIYAAPLARRGTTAAVGDWFMTGLFGDERHSRAADVGNYRAFPAPVLVIWGREDTVTPLDQGEFVAASFARGDLKVLDQVNHIPHIEKPVEVIRLIRDFMLGGDPAPSGATPAGSDRLRGTVE